MSEIQDFGIIGNGKSCALISITGSIDWLCWPRFDSPSFFGAILDPKIGGFWSIRPISYTDIKRQYIEDTNVLKTHFFSKTGEITLIDFMPAFSEEEKNKQLHPEHELIRIVECTKGEVEVEIHYNPRPNYGMSKAKIQDHGGLGLRIEIGQQLFALHSSIKLNLKDEGIHEVIKLKAGERIVFSLAYTLEGPAVIPSMENVDYKLSQTIDWWQKWANKAKYWGPYRQAVIRSALVLKLLGYAPSGAFIAAATASLPEKIGGNLNWDYRYCWLRDATFTIRSLLGLGYVEETEAFISWILHATRLTLPELKPVYDVFGEKITSERELLFLQGYKNSKPIRIGNAIRNQLQLDVYGEVIDGIAYFLQQGGKIDRDSKKMVSRIGEYVCKNWHRKDSGIWEERDDFEYYTFSHLMCWATLDKLLKNKKEFNLSTKNIKQFEETASLIRAVIEKEAWNSEIKAYTNYLHGKMMDACALLMPSFEFDKADSERMQQTYQRIKHVLEIGPGLIYRYEKSHQKEGAFLICSFWKIDFIARGGDTLDEGHREFKKILAYANDLGLFSEEVEVETGKLIGNFPQAFTHIGLINAALLLEEKQKHELE